MSITDELREWLKSLYTPNSATVKDEGERIADRIDAEHERKVGCTADEWDYWESTHIELPKDADGEYIHIGDVMDSKVDYLFDGKPFTVRAIVLCEDGWEAADGRFGNRYKPDSLRHHHAPTVEDVLREFAEKMNENLGMYTGEAIDADEWRDADTKTVEQYAAKLQLRED